MHALLAREVQSIVARAKTELRVATARRGFSFAALRECLDCPRLESRWSNQAGGGEEARAEGLLFGALELSRKPRLDIAQDLVKSLFAYGEARHVKR